MSKSSMMAVASAAAALLSSPAFADPLAGQVTAAGAPVAGATITLYAAGDGAPRQLAESRTGADGRFTLNADSGGAVVYVVAKGGKSSADKGSGDNPALALVSVLGSKPPASVTLNEMTTVASVWTAAQFLDGTALKGHALGLRIAAGYVPNFVDLESGGWGRSRIR
jgi:hypothetical protein